MSQSPFWKRVSSQIATTLGTPGMILGAFAIACLAFGLVVLSQESSRLRQTGRQTMSPLIAGWAHSVAVDDLGLTLPDYADRWRSTPTADRAARLRQLEQALATLAGKFDSMLDLVQLELHDGGNQPIARWPTQGFPSVDPDDLIDRVLILPAAHDQPPLDLLVRYRLSPAVNRPLLAIGISQRRLALAVLALSFFPLLSLLYILIQARGLRARAAREAAQAATLALADRTCHELGNVAFVLANEQGNLDVHLDQVERFASAHDHALAEAATRLGLDPDQIRRLGHTLRQVHQQHGYESPAELADSAAMTREVARQIALCSSYITLMVRELDCYLKQQTVPAQPVPQPLGPAIDDACTLIGPRLRAWNISLDRQPERETIGVLADRRLLVHALVNLIKNALEAIGQNTPGGRISLTVTTSDSDVLIDVQDNGPGIAAPASRRIFESSFTTKGPGRGRGLVIARDAIQAQGGSLKLQPPSTRGTHFQIRLPRARRVENDHPNP